MRFAEEFEALEKRVNEAERGAVTAAEELRETVAEAAEAVSEALILAIMLKLGVEEVVLTREEVENLDRFHLRVDGSNDDRIVFTHAPLRTFSEGEDQ